MPRQIIYTRRLLPSDAGKIARLEKKTYPRSQRAGRNEIDFALHEAEERSANLSVGLFDGPRLLGYGLAYRVENRQQSFEDFEVDSDVARGLGGEAIYVEDIVFSKAVGRHAFLFFGKLVAEFHHRGSGLPVDAFCVPPMLERWKKYEKGFRACGLQMTRTVAVRDKTHREDWVWVSWEPCDPSPSRIVAGKAGKIVKANCLPPGTELRLVQTEQQWEQLRDSWSDLVLQTADADAFATFDVCYHWWMQFGCEHQLHILALQRGETIVGIAPMMLSVDRIYGRYYRQLEFIGDNSLMERPKMLVLASEPAVENCLWLAILELRGKWDTGLLLEQADTSPPADIVAKAEESGRQVLFARPSRAPYVQLGADWDAYFGSLPKSSRKSVRRKIKKMRESGKVALRRAQDQTPLQAFERYLDVERRSWKARAGEDVGRKPQNIEYYRNLLQSNTRAVQFSFSFLEFDGESIAATFGMACNGRLSSLEICHDARFDRYSPGVVLTALEIKHFLESNLYAELDFLSGSLENKSSWATGFRESRDVYMLPSNAHGVFAREMMFRVVPGVKETLKSVGLFDVVLKAVTLYRRMRGLPD